MGNSLDDTVWLPETPQEALDRAVKRILAAANDLLLAADLEDEEMPVDHFVNAAIRLRDLANSLSPDKPDMPANVVLFVPRGAQK